MVRTSAASGAADWLRGRRAALVVALAALVCQLGCTAKEMVQISGKVVHKDGSPITGAVRTIRFEPTPNSNAAIRKAASGEIASDGTFTLFTRRPGDGVYPGNYAVTFTVLTKPMGGKSLIQPEYNSADSTPYEVQVTDDMTDLVYEVEHCSFASVAGVAVAGDCRI